MKLSIQVWMISGLVLGLAATSSAQITPDSTLPTNSRVTSLDGSGLPIDQIDDGTIRGTNLFHSFREFNVSEGRGAYFTNPDGIENILSRVTGNDPSNILGTLGVLGNANLFFMNPNGIIFGEKASLNIGGSFIATTANAIQLSSAGTFSASEPTKSNLLTVNPSALFFNGLAAQAVINQSQAQSLRGETNLLGGPVGLQVPTGQTLALVGGNVLLEGGNLTTKGGRIELGSVAGPGLVSLTPTDKGQSLGYEGIQNFRDVQLSQQATVDTSGAGSGDIQVRGRQMTLADGSSIVADTLGAETGGTLNVNASELVELNGTSASGIPSSIFARVQPEATGAGGNLTSSIFARVQPEATGAGGNLTIDTAKLNLRNGGQVATGASGKGSSGNLEVRASELEAIGYPSGLFTTVQEGATGDGGNLTVDTGQLILQDGAQVSAGTFGKGASGNLTVKARNFMELTGSSVNGFSSGLYTSVGSAIQQGATGKGGNLTVETERLILRDGAQVAAGTFGKGAAGNLEVNASDLVELSGTSTGGQFFSSLSTTVNPGATGAGGNLTVATEQLIIRDGAQVVTGTLGVGDAGDLIVRVSDFVKLTGTLAIIGSGLATQTQSSGAAGDLIIDTGQLIVQDGAFVSTSTFSEGQGGTLLVNASDSVEVIGTSAGGIPSGLGALTRGSGAAGDLTIDTEQLIVRDGARVTVSSEGTGDAGNLNVLSPSIRLDNQATLSADTTAGKGNIILDSQDIVLRRGSNITTDAKGTATGGNITIDADLLVALENSDISANAQDASGGQVIINAQGIVGTEFRDQLTPESDITATSALGPEFSGTVEINTPDTELQGSLTQLSANFVSPEQVVAGSCLARRNVEQGSFVVTGTGGLPRSPYEAISGRYNVTGVQPIRENGSVSKGAEVVASTAWKKGDPIQEAQGMIVTADGRTIVGTALQLASLAKAQNLVCRSN